MKLLLKGLKKGSAVKSMHYSPKGPEFCSQHSYQVDGNCLELQLLESRRPLLASVSTTVMCASSLFPPLLSSPSASPSLCLSL